MNQVFLRTDKGEYLPGETVCGMWVSEEEHSAQDGVKTCSSLERAVYLNICTPTEAHGVQLSFSGRETVCCNCDVNGTGTTLQASHDYVDYCNADLFIQKEPFALGSYCFPFRLQIPYVIPGTFHASSSDPIKAWSACVTYRMWTNIMGADAMVAEQDVVITATTPEALRDNHLTLAHEIQIASPGFLRRQVHVTVKPLANFVRSGESARLRMVFTNQLKSHACAFSIKLIRTLTLTLPLMSRPSLDASGDHAEEGSASQSVQHQTVEVEGGRTVVREMIGDLSQHMCSSVTLASGCGLDNIMIPLKTTAGKNVLPSVQGKHVQCDYSLEVGLRLGDSTVQTVTCPIMGVLPEKNAQWLSWKPQPWMNTAEVKLSKPGGPISPHEQLLGSEAFGRLPRFQYL